MRATIRKFVTSLVIVQACVCHAVGQEIIYGSNNGKYVTVLERKIYYEEYGTGMPLVMLHGGPGSISNFAKVIPELSKSFRVIAIDSPGHGHSERASALSYQLLAENASAFIDVMGIKQCYVVGWSDGGVTGLLLAANRPDKVSKVFVSGIYSNFDGLKDEFKVLWSTITPEVVEQSWGGWHLRYQKQYPENDWKRLVNDIRDMVNREKIYIPEEKLKSITAKVLLAWGDNDFFTWDHMAYLRNTVPDSKLMILPGTNHLTYNQQPEMMCLAIKNFFEK